MPVPATTDGLVMRTARWSLYAQVLFTAVTAASIALPLPSKDVALRDIAILEMASQAVEFCYYALAVFRYGAISTWTRYIDWFVSTPVMLLSTMAFFVYLKDDDASTGVIAELFAADRVAYTLAVLGFNALMLVFGLLHTFAYRPLSSLAAGMVSFVAAFATLLVGYVRGTDATGVSLFLFVYVVWGAYGVAATLDERRKNVAYNALDIVSKNFYGVFIFIYSVAVVQG